MISVLLADTHPAYRNALALSLSEDESLQIVGQAGDLFGLELTTATLHPQVIVLNSTLLRQLGSEGIGTLKQDEGGPVIVVLSMSTSEDVTPKDLIAMVDGYVSKELAISALLDTIHSLAG
jgi:two-component system nitrate/nitrite response regulator NarL